MVSLRRCWVFTAVAMISATAALRYKYKIEFTACSDIYCQQGAIIEQKAPWKYVEDGQCKSYYHHTFPAWTHTWVGEPNGRECPQCPDSFGSCTISIYEKPGCTGLLYGGINEVSNGYFSCVRMRTWRMAC